MSIFIWQKDDDVRFKKTFKNNYTSSIMEKIVLLIISIILKTMERF